MNQFFTTYALLGLHNGNLPPFQGARERRYQSIEKMLDLFDVMKRIGPKSPVSAFFLDPTEAEWEDDMTYLGVEYPVYRSYLGYATLVSGMFLYNYNILFHNKNMGLFTKSWLGMLFIFSNYMYYRYRKEVLKCNLFDEYVQLRADELIKEREYLMHTTEMKAWIWYAADLKETLLRVHRQAYNNHSSDFKDSELILQDFVRRYTDETKEFPLDFGDARIGL